MRAGFTHAALGALMGLALLSADAVAQNESERDPNFGRGERVSGESFATRSPVIAPHGAAATAHPLATQTAIDVMRSGGSAVDAAIAANAMLGLVEPTGNGIGGDIFVIVWDPRTSRLYGYNGSGRTPQGMSLAEMHCMSASGARRWPICWRRQSAMPAKARRSRKRSRCIGPTTGGVWKRSSRPAGCRNMTMRAPPISARKIASNTGRCRMGTASFATPISPTRWSCSRQADATHITADQ